MRALLLLPVLAGCATAALVLDPPLAQLARWREAADAAVAAEAVRCPPGHAACPLLHRRRAEACLAMSLAARAPGAACPPRPEHLRCAAEGFAAARALRPDPALAAGEAQALLCLGDLTARRDDAEAAARAARDSSSALLEARASILRARLAPDAAGRCAIAAAARHRPAPPAREAEDLRRLLLSCPQGDAR